MHFGHLYAFLKATYGSSSSAVNLHSNIPLNPLVLVLGKRIPNINIPTQKLANSILTAARCTIAGKWKNTFPPTEADLLERVRYIRRMEQLTALRNDNVDNFNKIWYSWDIAQLGGPLQVT
ncbi:hypothetical protein XELAEV_18001694mg [Xenopus laevis]|nr:hypothetical protein XELAEV_18001694mg [Xenopus laevis]